MTKINGEIPRYAVIKASGCYAGIFCVSYEEAAELASQHENAVIYQLVETDNG